MTLNVDLSVATSEQVEGALCRRLEGIRLARNLTQRRLAEEAGVSLRTIGRLEKGEGVSLDTFLRVLIALDLQHALEGLLPDPAIRPVERVEARGRERRRARPVPPAEPPATWTWGDGDDDGD